jgi:hypothetical protein
MITLTRDEAIAVRKGLCELISNSGAPEVRAQKKVLAKIEKALGIEHPSPR